jgi:hypothetical protein
MNTQRDDAAWWLGHEQAEDEAAAEAAFAGMCRALPRVELEPDAFERMMLAVCAAQRRRRRLEWAARTAAAVVVTTVAAAIGYGLLEYASAGLATAAATVASQGAGWLALFVRVAVDWWALALRLGEEARAFFSRPEALGVLWAMEMVGVLALCWLHRLVRPQRVPAFSTETGS